MAKHLRLWNHNILTGCQPSWYIYLIYHSDAAFSCAIQMLNDMFASTSLLPLDEKYTQLRSLKLRVFGSKKDLKRQNPARMFQLGLPNCVHSSKSDRRAVLGETDGFTTCCLSIFFQSLSRQSLIAGAVSTWRGMGHYWEPWNAPGGRLGAHSQRIIYNN